jgi:hypothetical protein
MKVKFERDLLKSCRDPRAFNTHRRSNTCSTKGRIFYEVTNAGSMSSQNMWVSKWSWSLLLRLPLQSIAIDQQLTQWSLPFLIAWPIPQSSLPISLSRFHLCIISSPVTPLILCSIPHRQILVCHHLSLLSFSINTIQ